MDIVFITTILFGIGVFFIIRNVLLAGLLAGAAAVPVIYYLYFSRDKFEGPIKYSKINSILVIFVTAIYFLESKIIVFMSYNLVYWLLGLSTAAILYDWFRRIKYLRIIFNLVYWGILWEVFSIIFFINTTMQQRDIALSLTALFVLFVSIISTLRILRDKKEEGSEGS